MALQCYSAQWLARAILGGAKARIARRGSLAAVVHHPCEQCEGLSAYVLMEKAYR